MTAQRDPERLIRAYLADGQDQLPDRAYDAVRDTIDRTRQRTVFGPWRETPMLNFARVAIAAAAVVAFGVVGIGMLTRSTGPGTVATPSPVAPSPSPQPSASPTTPAAVLGPLEAGTYVARPFGILQVTFTVPDGWEALGNGVTIVGLAPDNDGWQAPDGMGVGFLRVGSLNADPCQWDGPEGDIAVGPSVDDLITALTQQTAYDVSDPADVSLAGYSGKQLDIVFPTDSVATCDEQEYRIWNGNGGFDIYALGPGARWHIWVLDVDGERVVVLAHDYPGTSQADQAEWDSIVKSVTFEP